MKCLRTDRGGEFISAEFSDFCGQHGVKRQLTTAYTPQQNGIVECKNCIVMNLVRTVLTEKKVPKRFWPKAVMWVNHVLNRSPTLIVKDVTSEEAWSGVKSLVDYFWVFKCVGYVYMFEPVANKIIISRNTIFYEDHEWDWKNSENETDLD